MCPTAASICFYILIVVVFVVYACPCVYGIVAQTNCPAGKWSDVAGLGTVCTLNCSAGYVCASGASSATAQECGGQQYYCPSGSSVPLQVGAGYYSYGGAKASTATSRALCPGPLDSASNGSAVYCDGSGDIKPCPAGSFGNTSGLSSASCSGACTAGYYCPSGAANSTVAPCGDPGLYVTIWGGLG